MDHQKIISLLGRINEIISPIEHETDLDRDRYALLKGDSLFSGNLGLVIYHMNYYTIFNDSSSKDRSLNLLQDILYRVEEGTSTLSNYTLSYGLSGLGIVINQLISEQFIDDGDIDLGNLDELIYEWIIDRIKNNDSEFMHGAFGAIRYLSTNSKNTTISTLKFEELVKLLMSKSITSDHEGVYFDLFNKFIPEYPKNTINLSLSHGLSGILVILLDLIDKGLIGEAYKNLAYDIAKYLNGKIEDVNFEKKIYCHADSVVSPDIKGRRNTRLAWCYGDLNQVLAFLRMGQTFQDQYYLSLSHKIGLTTTYRKDFEQTYISDSQFCHGTSGMVEIYRYLYEQTSISEYLDAKNYWLNKTVEYIETELDSGYYTEKKRTAELLEGLIGVALVLLSEVGKSQDQKLSWNNIFLLN